MFEQENHMAQDIGKTYGRNAVARLPKFYRTYRFAAGTENLDKRGCGEGLGSLTWVLEGGGTASPDALTRRILRLAHGRGGWRRAPWRARGGGAVESGGRRKESGMMAKAKWGWIRARRVNGQELARMAFCDVVLPGATPTTRLFLWVEPWRSTCYS
jgi:hypothetical protein